MLGSSSASPRVRFDCVLLLSDLLESAITTQARKGGRAVPASGCGTCNGDQDCVVTISGDVHPLCWRRLSQTKCDQMIILCAA